MRFNPYPFERLAKLLEDRCPNPREELISLAIGEPQFQTPEFILQEIEKYADEFSKYPKSSGEEFLKESILGFIKRRFALSLDMKNIIPTFGTREVLFNLPQFLCSDIAEPKIAFTNPFYQIYEGAAIASKAKIEFIGVASSFESCKEYLRDVDVVILNYPNNPTGEVLSKDELKEWVRGAHDFGFVLINDECYSEIYQDIKPVSILEASYELYGEYKNVIAINSLSKRSSCAGLRAGFVAGDSEILESYMRYRTYVGCALPLPLQRGAAKAWSDDVHAEEIRKKYSYNMKEASRILDIKTSEATFYLWLDVGDDLAFCRYAYENYNLKLLPGSYLGRLGAGEGMIRVALVYEGELMDEGLDRLKKSIENVIDRN